MRARQARPLGQMIEGGAGLDGLLPTLRDRTETAVRGLQAKGAVHPRN
jgi:hypothetical protein